MKKSRILISITELFQLDTIVFVFRLRYLNGREELHREGPNMLNISLYFLRLQAKPQDKLLAKTIDTMVCESICCSSITKKQAYF